MVVTIHLRINLDRLVSYLMRLWSPAVDVGVVKAFRCLRLHYRQYEIGFLF